MTYDELKRLIEQRGVHQEFGEQGDGWAIEQVPAELALFIVRMQAIGVTSCLEIGTGYKGGLSRFLAADIGWRVATVDVRQYGHSFPGVDYFTIHDDSPASYQQLMNTLKGCSFDLVFIDGNHSYARVSDDYARFSGYADKVIAFHDIGGLRTCEGVLSFWNELRNRYPADTLHEIIEHSGRRSGIGYIDWSVLNDTRYEHSLSPSAGKEQRSGA